MAEMRPRGRKSEEETVPLREVRAEEVATVTRDDRIRWSGIWAGVITAFALLIVLSAVGTAVGLAITDLTDLAALSSVGLGLLVWGFISGLIALFVGGYLASRLSAAVGSTVGGLHGLVVWALALVLGVLLAASGIGTLLGFAGTGAAAFQDVITPEAIQDVQIGPAQLQAAGLSVGIAFAWFSLAAILGLVVSILGGISGARRR